MAVSRALINPKQQQSGKGSEVPGATLAPFNHSDINLVSPSNPDETSGIFAKRLQEHSIKSRIDTLESLDPIAVAKKEQALIVPTHLANPQINLPFLYDTMQSMSTAEKPLVTPVKDKNNAPDTEKKSTARNVYDLLINFLNKINPFSKAKASVAVEEEIDPMTGKPFNLKPELALPDQNNLKKYYAAMVKDMNRMREIAGTEDSADDEVTLSSMTRVEALDRMALIQAIKDSNVIKSQIELDAQITAAEKNKENKALNQELIKVTEDIQKMAKTHKILKWIDVGFTTGMAAVSAAMVIAVVATVATGGSALAAIAAASPFLAPIACVLAIAKGISMITKAVYDYKTGKATAQLVGIRHDRETNNFKINDELSIGKEMDTGKMHHWKTLRQILDRITEASANIFK